MGCHWLNSSCHKTARGLAAAAMRMKTSLIVEIGEGVIVLNLRVGQSEYPRLGECNKEQGRLIGERRPRRPILVPAYCFSNSMVQARPSTRVPSPCLLSKWDRM